MDYIKAYKSYGYNVAGDMSKIAKSISINSLLYTSSQKVGESV